MATKKKAIKKSVKKPVKKHFLWSIFFLALAMAMYVFLLFVYTIVGFPIFWALLATGSSLIGLILIGYERRTGQLGKGHFLWSIFFVAFTVGVGIYIAITDGLIPSHIALLSSVIALGILIREKYRY